MAARDSILASVGHVAIIGAYGLLAVVTAQAIPIVADERSPILGVPGSVTYICLFLGFVLIALVHLGELLNWVKEKHEQVTGAF